MQRGRAARGPAEGLTVNDLFGNAVVEPVKKRRRKVRHAQPPGTGPAGETCGTCDHLHVYQPGSNLFFKCGLLKPVGGAATDIRKKDPACRMWKLYIETRGIE